MSSIASANRRFSFRATRAHVNTLIATSGETITARARWLARNNGYAANAVDAFANHVVGDGIKPSSKIADQGKKEELQKLWLAWTDEADAEGLTDFFGLQRRAAREVFLAGEVFLRIRTRRPEDGLTVPMQLQMLPSEMLPQDMTRVLPGAGSIRQGIEFDGIGRRVAYHFLRRHPGDMTDPGLAGETVRVPASEVIHILDPVEAGQLRGVSRFAAAVVKLFTLDLYDDAELERKKTAAMFAMFITSPAPETALDPAEDDLEVEPGQVVRLDPGEDVTTPSTPDSGSTYEPFQYRTLLQIGAALGVPYGYLTGDTAKGNFSNILDGRWDNAAVEVWRVNWSAPSQRVLLRRGAIGQIRRGRLPRRSTPVLKLSGAVPMRDVHSRSVWWVWWLWWISPGRYLCLSPEVSATWKVATRDAMHHAMSHDVTVYRSGRKQPTNLHQTHQTNRRRTGTNGTVRENFRTVVTSRNRRIAGRRAGPPGPIRMWGRAAHKPASVRGRK